MQVVFFAFRSAGSLLRVGSSARGEQTHSFEVLYCV